MQGEDDVEQVIDELDAHTVEQIDPRKMAAASIGAASRRCSTGDTPTSITKRSRIRKAICVGVRTGGLEEVIDLPFRLC